MPVASLLRVLPDRATVERSCFRFCLRFFFLPPPFPTSDSCAVRRSRIRVDVQASVVRHAFALRDSQRSPVTPQLPEPATAQSDGLEPPGANAGRLEIRHGRWYTHCAARLLQPLNALLHGIADTWVAIS